MPELTRGGTRWPALSLGVWKCAPKRDIAEISGRIFADQVW